jgi:hypothetical protein
VSREELIAVALTPGDHLRLLLSDVESARSRAAKALAGDRLDIVRYEALSSQLEHWSLAQRSKGLLEVKLPVTAKPPAVVTAKDESDLAFLPAAWRDRFTEALAAGDVLVTLRTPLNHGSTSDQNRKTIEPPPPTEPWKSKTGARGAGAVQERFQAQIEEALAGGRGSLSPSDIQNAILTETLRRYVGQRGQRADVPVEYRDGSRSQHPFPLRSLKLDDSPLTDVDELRFALLSIRHTEMDAVVDGAFLRNSEISQLRLAADTDDLVFEISREQLLALTDDGTAPVALRIYQTGLDTAIVGFYRAVVHHLLAHPRSLSVTPMFFQGGKRPQPRRRLDQRPNGRDHGTETRQPTTSAQYREGAVWATK